MRITQIDGRRGLQGRQASQIPKAPERVCSPTAMQIETRAHKTQGCVMMGKVCEICSAAFAAKGNMKCCSTRCSKDLARLQRRRSHTGVRRRYGQKNSAKERERHRRYRLKNQERLTWTRMLTRCNNPNSISYHNYGGRGIKVLYDSFQQFYSDVGPKPGKQYSIDRIYNNGHYALGNCCWATPREQSANRRERKITTALAREIAAIEASDHSNRVVADMFGISKTSVHRVRTGWRPGNIHAEEKGSSQ